MILKTSQKSAKKHEWERFINSLDQKMIAKSRLYFLFKKSELLDLKKSLMSENVLIYQQTTSTIGGLKLSWHQFGFSSLRGQLSSKEEWFVFLKGKSSGPYSMRQLKHLPGFSPDTLVWKEGFQCWIKARWVKELDPLFEEEQKPSEEEESVEQKRASGEGPVLLEAITINQDPSPFFLWLILLLVVIIYTFYLMHR